MNYWQKRNALDLIAQEKKGLIYEQQLLQEFQNAKDEIKYEIELFYSLYAKDNKITYAEAQKLLSSKELTTFRKNLEAYKNTLEKLNTSTSKKLLTQINKDMNRVNITRLEALEKQIEYKIDMLKNTQNNKMSDLLSNSYEDSYYRTMFNTQQNIGIGYSFTHLNSNAIEKAILTKFQGSNFSDRIWQEKDKLILNLNTTLAQSIIRGGGVSQVANEVVKTTNTSYYNAVRLARTELNRVYNRAAEQSYKDSDVVEQYEFVATLDDRTSDICASLDGKKFNKDEYEVGINAPPMHPNCRSTTVPVVNSAIKERMAKDKSGNYIKVPSSMTYLEWAEKYCPEKYVNLIKQNLGEYKKATNNTNISKQSEQIKKEQTKNINENRSS